MGAGQSSHAHSPSRALHVLRVTPSSPASQTNIEPFFDFVVGFEGDSLSSQNSIDASELERIVESHEGRTLKLLVWNSKNQETRVVPIIPSRAWSQLHPEGPNPHEPASMTQPSLLGLSMRMCEPEFSMDNVWHVLDVLEGSPAESAGLVPFGDWIIGWSGGALNAEGDFYDLVEAHVDKPLRVYVYSHDFDALREVVLVPNRQWGGEGLLGCVFGFGLLHRIPPQPTDRLPGATPPELTEPTDEYEEQELFVPADAQPEAPYNPTQMAEWRQQEHDEWNRESLAARLMYEQSNSQPGGHAPERITHEGIIASESSHDTHSHLDEPSTSNRTFPSQGTPRRMNALTPNSTTPTRSSLGTLMNGTDTARVFSPPHTQNTQPLSRPVRASSSNFQARADENMTSDESGNDDDDEHDGETSVAGTETTTEMGSETASHGSLTSVD